MKLMKLMKLMKRLTDEERQRLSGFLPDEMQEAKNHKQFQHSGYVCPVCHSGEHEHGTGAVEWFSGRDDNTTLWKCHACGAFGDIITYVSKRDNLNFLDSLKYLRGKYISNDPVIKRPTQANRPEPKQAATETHEERREYLTRCHNALWGSAGEEYLLKRGFTTKTMSDYRLGFDSAHEQIVIPYLNNTGYYCSRYIGTDASHPRYIKSRALDSNGEPLFNVGALNVRDHIYHAFVVEGQLDALSIEQAGYKAIALGGQGANRLVETMKKQRACLRLIIAFDNEDNDKTRQAATELKTKLLNIGVKAVCDFEVFQPYKDANAFLQADSEGFRAALTESVNRAYKRG